MADQCSELLLSFLLTASWYDGSPPKIKSIRITDNPFNDMVSRITAAEKRAQQHAREEVQRVRLNVVQQVHSA